MKEKWFPWRCKCIMSLYNNIDLSATYTTTGLRRLSSFASPASSSSSDCSSFSSSGALSLMCYTLAYLSVAVSRSEVETSTSPLWIPLWTCQGEIFQTDVSWVFLKPVILHSEKGSNSNCLYRVDHSHLFGDHTGLCCFRYDQAGRFCCIQLEKMSFCCRKVLLSTLCHTC